jgi:hypothetical protein
LLYPNFHASNFYENSKKTIRIFIKSARIYVSFPDKINSTRQIFDKARHRIELCSSGNLKEREGKWNRAQTVIFCDFEKSKASDTQAMSSLDRVMASPLTL